MGMERELDIVARLLNRGVVILCGPPADTAPLMARVVAKLRVRQTDMERTSTVREVVLGRDALTTARERDHVTLLVDGLDDVADLTVVERQQLLDAFATLIEELDPHATAHV